MITYKSRHEIEIMRKANQIIAKLYRDILPQYIKPGVSTYELDQIAEDFIRKNGAKPAFKGYKVSSFLPAYPATLCTSINEQVVHGIPRRKDKLKEGDIISIDAGTIVDGYCGDAAITYAVGEIDDESKKLLKITEESRRVGIEQAIVGNRIGDIGNAIQSFVESQGYSVVRDYCGHGIGRHMHEDPQIPNFGPKNVGVKIENGMVICIEPMVNQGSHKVKTLRDGWTVVTLDKKRSAHFEHSIAIIDGKPVILSEIE